MPCGHVSGRGRHSACISFVQAAFGFTTSSRQLFGREVIISPLSVFASQVSIPEDMSSAADLNLNLGCSVLEIR